MAVIFFLQYVNVQIVEIK